MLIVLVISIFLSISSYGQSSMILRYYKVTEFVFDYDVEDYKQIAEHGVSGAISVDQVKIFIKGYNDQENKTLKIIENKNEGGSDRSLYLCVVGDRWKFC